MTNRQKLKQLQKIINKYIDILQVLPNGGEIDEDVAEKLGIPRNLKSFIDRAYKQGKFKSKTRARISFKEIEKHFDELTGKDKEFVKLLKCESEQDISNLLEKQRTKLNRLAVEALKRQMTLVETTFKDEPIPKRWLAGELRKITRDTKQDWDMVIRTELMNTQQEGMAQAILDGSSPYSNDRGETMVFKRPNPDACQHCIKHYLERDRVTPRLFKLSELMANGTNYSKKVQDWKATLGVMHPHCYDKETEILTNNGFKLFKDLTGEDLVYTADTETMQPEWQKPSKYISYHYKGDMLHFGNTRFDMLVTPKHKMLVQSSTTKKYKLIEADSFSHGSSLKIPSGINWSGAKKEYLTLGGKKVDTETYVKFMAYWLSDGSCSFYNNKYYIQIAQTNNQWMFNELENLPFRIYKSKDSLLIHDEELGKELVKYGKCYEKYIPDIIKSLDKETLKMFLKSYAKCDGHIRKGKEWKGYKFGEEISFYTTSNKLASDLGELIMKAGGKPTYFLNEFKGKEVKFRNGTYKINHNVWSIRWNKNTNSIINNMIIKKIPYDDMVYCVEVPKHHTLYVRRNGKCAWSGNCQCQLQVMPRGCSFDKNGQIIIDRKGR